MLTTTRKKYEWELKTSASKLSLRELNNLIDQCLDHKKYDDAQIYATIYARRMK